MIDKDLNPTGISMFRQNDRTEDESYIVYSRTYAV